MSQNVAAPGFFGKVPARGDFLVRRMPAGFQTAWETWLSTLVVAARSGLGAAWPDAWLTAPLWHFSLGRDVAAPNGAMGVLVASVDRVGRFFPLSIIGGSSAASALRADDWARSAEALALAALDDDFDPDALDGRLSVLGPPPVVAGAGRPAGVWRLPMDEDWPARPLDALSDAAWLPPGPGQSVWWCRGSERMVPLHIRADGLPNQRLAAAMVTGVFDPADGGDAATDPACLAMLAAAPVPSAAEILPASGDAGDPGGSTDAVAPAPAMAPTTAAPIETGWVDPLGDDPVWQEAHDPLQAVLGPLVPNAVATDAEREAAPDGSAAPAAAEGSEDPLAFLVREDDPLADRPGPGHGAF